MAEANITLPDYKIDPPYGGSPLAWWKFFLAPHKWPLIGCVFNNLFRQTYFRSQPFFFGLLIGLFETGRAQEEPHLVLGWFIAYAAVSVIIFAMLYVIIWIGRIVDKVSKEISLFGFRHYLSLPESWHEEHSSGEKLQRLMTARKASLEFMLDAFWHGLPLPAALIGVALSISLLNAPLYFIALFYGMIACYLLVSYITGNWMFERFADYNQTLEKVVGGVYEFLVSTATVRFFNLKNHVIDKGLDLETANHVSHMRAFRTAFFRWLTINCTTLFWLLLIVGLASWEIMQGHLTLAAYSTIILLVLTIWMEIEGFAITYVRLIEQWEGFKRLTHILNQRPAIEDAPDALTLDTDEASITFEDASFRYQEQAAVIENLSLHVQPGEKVGLMGPSGAGKSTLIKLIMRFYDVDSGVVKIDDQDIRGLTRETIQHHIAVIPQDVVLFNHSLMENIRYGRLEASDEEVIEAARRAHAYDFVQDLPDGFDTVVGERGVKLSGGQRQRIAIARAILKDAPILILDEATSALDSESEKLLQASLETLMQGKTVIAIAHRLSTINKLDRLVVMEQGKIVEDGTHDALIERDGLYAKLWAMQSGGFLKE